MFFFNDILPNDEDFDLQGSFNKLIVSYALLMKKSEGKIDGNIVTSDFPSRLKIMDTYLKTLIKEIPLQDVRNLALRFFTKAPIADYIADDNFKESVEQKWDFSIWGKPCISLFYAYWMGWPIISIPLNEKMLTNKLAIVNSDGHQYTINNFYGINGPYILREINHEPGERFKLLCIFDKRWSEFSPEIEDKLSRLKPEITDYIIEKFRDADNKGLIFPPKQHLPYVRKAEGAKITNCFELRSKNGMRVYFGSAHNILYMSMYYDKGEGEGKEQTADLQKASSDINKWYEKISTDELICYLA